MEADLDRELAECREADASAIHALRLVRDRLSLGLDEAFERLRRHPSWTDLVLRHELDDRRDAGVVQTVVLEGITIAKEYRHDESASDPPEEDDYEYFEYEFELDGRVYDGRRYVGEDDATIGRAARRLQREDARRIAAFLIEREGVRRVNRYHRLHGVYDRIVAIGPGWSDLDPLVLLALRERPLDRRTLRLRLTELDAVRPPRRELGGSLARLGAAGLVEGDRHGYALTAEGGQLVAPTGDAAFWDEYMWVGAALDRRPPPDA